MPKFRRRPKPSSEPVVEAMQYKQSYSTTPGCPSVTGSDWFVQHEDGKQEHMSDEKFKKQFEPIE